MKKLLLFIGIVSLSLTGCMTAETRQMISAESDKADSCQQRILTTKLDIAKARAKRPVSTFTITDERNYVMMTALDRMADITIAVIEANAADGTGSCDDRVIALINDSTRTRSKLIGLGAQGLNVGGWLIGANILVDGINDGGASSSSSTQISGSRVNIGSGNNGGMASSSGSGLGTANAFESGFGNQAGGILPRQINDSPSDAVSNSGSEDAPVTLPVEPEAAP